MNASDYSNASAASENATSLLGGNATSLLLGRHVHPQPSAAAQWSPERESEGRWQFLRTPPELLPYQLPRPELCSLPASRSKRERAHSPRAPRYRQAQGQVNGNMEAQGMDVRGGAGAVLRGNPRAKRQPCRFWCRHTLGFCHRLGRFDTLSIVVLLRPQTSDCAGSL